MPRQKGSASGAKLSKTAELGVTSTKLIAKPKQQQQHTAAAEPGSEANTLVELEQKKADLSAKLREVERQIYDMESKYYQNANPQGNALKGYHGLLHPKSKKTGKQEERIFSGSSVTGTDHLHA